MPPLLVIAMLAACGVALLPPNGGFRAAPATDAAPPQAGVHGSADVFVAPGVALAWGVLRAKDDAATSVLVRVEADAAMYGSLAATGVDPFTHASQALLARHAIGRALVVRLPRARFAELPRTEWRLFEAVEPRAGDAPALLVYYQGVPDTAPEFDDAAKLDAYLVERIARARRDAKGK